MTSTAYWAEDLPETPNVTPFPSKEVELNQPATNDHHDNNNNNYNNNIARAREKNDQLLQEERMGTLAQLFEDVFERKMPRVVEQEIRQMMDRGVDHTLISEVITYTASAPRPSWAYSRAVIWRNFQKGINDWNAFNRSLYLRGRAGQENSFF